MTWGVFADRREDQVICTVDDYVDGRGENARDVRKVKFKLADKRAALMDIAKLFGWITERRDNKIVDEFDTMSDEQIDLPPKKWTGLGRQLLGESWAEITQSRV